MLYLFNAPLNKYAYMPNKYEHMPHYVMFVQMPAGNFLKAFLCIHVENFIHGKKSWQKKNSVFSRSWY